MPYKRVVTRQIVFRYATALIIIGLLAIATQVYLQVYLNQLTFDTREVNLAGKMRMLSQRTTKLSLMLEKHPNDDYLRDALQQTIDELALIFDALEQGDSELKIRAATDSTLATLFAETRPLLDATLGSAQCLVRRCRETEAAMQEVLRNDDRLLESISRIPRAFDELATASVRTLQLIELCLLLLTLLVLLAQALFIFRPLVRTVTSAMDLVRDQTLETQRLRRLAVMSEMSGGIAHEINSPLTAAGLSVQHLQRQLDRNPGPDKAALKAQLAAIDADLHRVGDVVAAVRGLALGQHSSSRQPVDVAQLFNDAVAEFQRRHPVADIPVRVLPPARGLTVQGVNYQLQQLILSLLRNAAEAASSLDDPWIELSAEHRDYTVVLRVRDAGTGIAPEIVEVMFDPFFSTKEVDGDMGLGLAMCQTIMALHGGHIRYELRNGHTCLSLDFPR